MNITAQRREASRAARRGSNGGRRDKRFAGDRSGLQLFYPVSQLSDIRIYCIYMLYVYIYIYMYMHVYIYIYIYIYTCN